MKDKKASRITLNLLPEEARRVEVIAALEDRTVASVARRLLLASLEAEERRVKAATPSPRS